MTMACMSSADKILLAATELFASNNFDGTSIKDISKLSGVNSALISYYFGGKKNLYQEVLNTQSLIFLDLIEDVKKKPLSVITSYSIHYTKLYDNGSFMLFFEVGSLDSFIGKLDKKLAE